MVKERLYIHDPVAFSIVPSVVLMLDYSVDCVVPPVVPVLDYFMDYIVLPVVPILDYSMDYRSRVMLSHARPVPIITR